MRQFKFLYRKFRYSRKRTIFFSVLFFIILSLGIGYAFLTTTLNITGTLNVASSRWDVHFENIEISENSIEATTAPTITEDTTVSFAATLANPGEMYEFTIDIVNDGT